MPADDVFGGKNVEKLKVTLEVMKLEVGNLEVKSRKVRSLEVTSQEVEKLGS